MGVNIGAFGAGFANTLLKAEANARDREYKKALIEHSKLQTKQLENKLKLAETGQANMSAVLNRVFPGMGGQQQAIPQAGAPMTTPAQPGAVGGGLSQLSPEEAFALDMVMKQGPADWDPKTREHAVPKWHGTPSEGMYSTHYGNIKGVVPPGQKFVQQEVQNADGSKSMIWVPQPPMQSPLFNQGGGGGQSGGGTPGAGVGPYGMQTQPPGVTPANIGRMNMIMQAQSKLGEIEKLLYPDGKLDRILIAKATVPGGGIGRGSQLYSKMYQLVDSALRIETGAQANATEIETKMSEYWPRLIDTEETIKEKFRDLTEYANGVVKLGDPTGKIREMRGPKPSLNLGKSQVSPQQAEQMLIQRGYKKDPQTGQWVK